MAKRERRAVITHRTKVTFVFNYVQKMTSQLLAVGKTKDARLFNEMMKWYYRVMDRQNRREVVFEPWMLTTDSVPENELKLIDTFANIFRTPKLSFLPALAVMFILLFFSGLAFDTYGQNKITGTIKSIPDNDQIKGKITLEDVTTQKKYVTGIDSLTGQFSIDVPEGTYKRQIEAENHSLFIDTLNINADTTLDKEMIKNMQVNSQIYRDANKSFLFLTKVLTGTSKNQTGQILVAWPNYRNIRLFANTSTMPAGWREGFDRVKADVTAKSEGKMTFREEQTDSLGGISFFFVPTSQIPSPGAGNRGFTFKSKNEFGLYAAECYVATDLNNINDNEETIMREMARAIGLFSFSMDNRMVMYDISTHNKVFHPDEGKILEILSTIKQGTDMFPYKDSVITSVNMPPILTAKLPKINILEGAGETFVAKLSEHFKDPEDKPINYVVNSDNIYITSSTRTDSLFITSASGFSGNVSVVVEAYDADGEGQFVSDTCKIEVLTEIRDEVNKPTNYNLSQNYPNPFNPTTTISFSLPERAKVTLNIYNQLGEKVAVLANGEKTPGSHTVEWNGANMPSGIYFYQLQTEKYRAVKKLLLMK